MRHAALIVFASLRTAQAACPAALVLEGPAELTAPAAVFLARRGVSLSRPPPGCPAMRARLSRDGNAIEVQFWGESGTARVRSVSQLSTVVSLLESWTRRDLNVFDPEPDAPRASRFPSPAVITPPTPPPFRRPERFLSISLEGVGADTPRGGARVGFTTTFGVLEVGGAARVRAYFPEGGTPGADGLQIHALGSVGVPFVFPLRGLSLTPTLRAGLGLIEHLSSVILTQRSGALGAAFDGALAFRHRLGPSFGYFVEVAWEESVPLWRTPRASTWVTRGSTVEGSLALHLGGSYNLF